MEGSGSEKSMKHRDVVSNFLFKTGKKKAEEGEVALVALFKRSEHPNIHTYRGKLAPISGSIDQSDANALAAAIRELREETKLVADKDISLEFSGKPFSFVDEGAGRSWTVHAFGWTFLRPDAESSIEIDWEHSGWEWVLPEQVLSGELKDKCVPNLDKSLRRVYFGPHGLFPGDHPWITRENAAGKTFMAGLDKLKTDHENGARVLATEAVKCLEQIAKDFQASASSRQEEQSKDQEWWICLRMAAWHLIYSGRPSMNAAISSAIIQALQNIIPLIKPDGSVDFQAVVDELSTSVSQRSESSSKIAKAFESYVSSILPEPSSDCKESNDLAQLSILTLSSSSTIRASLLHILTSLPYLDIHLNILESRPLCEGASLAANLIQALQTMESNDSSLPSPLHRLHITLAPDTHLTHLVQQEARHRRPKLLLLGADRITSTGHIINKMGSLSAAIVARALSPGTQIIVVSEADKIAKPSSPPSTTKEQNPSDEESLHSLRSHTSETNSPSEVTTAYPSSITSALSSSSSSSDDLLRIENIYFEPVPSRYIDRYISDVGVIGKEEIRQKSLEMARLEQEVFEGVYDDDD